MQNTYTPDGHYYSIEELCFDSLESSAYAGVKSLRHALDIVEMARLSNPNCRYEIVSITKLDN